MIGLFDSGVGGLTVLRAIRARAPQADIVYFGDIAHAPYGLRTQEELHALTRSGVMRLMAEGAHDVVSACNSASLSFLEGAFSGVRFVEMTRPTARAMRLIAGARVLLLATEATIRSRIYEDALNPIVQLIPQPAPLLASAIENGESEETIHSIVEDACSHHKHDRIDAVLLGCTHYPLAQGIIRNVSQSIWGNLLVIDPAETVAEEVVSRFSIAGSGITRFLISKESNVFRSLVKSRYGANKYPIEVV